MKVIVACEFSQTVAKAFRERGHEAYSCDVLPTEGNAEWHIQDDVLSHVDDGWDMMIAHPPCTYLSNSGVSWLYRKAGRWEQMRDGAAFFKALLDASIPRIAVENPIMHKHAVDIIGRRQDQVIHPWQFGHGETKATCLWLKNLSRLEPTNVVDGREHRLHRLPPSANRWRERSRTYQGIADAMAEQWGKEFI